MKPLAGAIVLIACTLSACSLSFATVGTWSTERPPPISLLGTTSVVMPDGEVIFLGGFDSRTGPLNGVLRFDPKDNSWTQGAPEPFQQTGYAVAALSNGLVLVAGGGGLLGGAIPLPVVAPGGGAPGGGNGLLATTWLYSLQLNAWTKAGNLHVARSGAAAVLLTDGRVLIAGGTVPLTTPDQPSGGGTDFGFSTSAETFDPLTNSWSLVGSMHVARGPMALVALPNGMALAAGGCVFANGALSNAFGSAEIFDPSTEAWAVTTPLPEPRCGGSGVRLPDGRALVTGGSNVQAGSVTDAVVYDQQSRGWTTAGSTVEGASEPILLANGQVFVAAVQTGPAVGGLVTDTVGGKVFDPASDDWSFATSTSALVQFRVSAEESPPVVAQTGDTAIVFLGTAGLAFTFDPSGAPPPALVLDSSGLAWILAALATALCLWLASYYLRNRVHRGA